MATFRDGTSTHTNGASSINAAKPTLLQTGDIMLAHLIVNATIVVTAPSGWTLLDQTGEANSLNPTGRIYWKIATASEPASYTWTFSGAAGAQSLVITAWHTASSDQPQAGNLPQVASASSIDTKVLLAARKGTIVHFFGHGTGAGFSNTLPGGHSEIYRYQNAVTAGWNQLVSSQAHPNGGDTPFDVLNLTASASSRHSMAVLLADPAAVVQATGIASEESFGNPTVTQTPPTDRAWMVTDASGTRASGTTHSIAIPTPHQKDDLILIVLQASVGATDPVWTLPSGWLPLRGSAQSTTAPDTDIQAFYKWATASEPFAVDWISSVSVPIHFWTAVYRNSHLGGPYGASYHDSTSDTTWRWNELAATMPKAVAIAAISTVGTADAAPTPPTDYRLRYHASDTTARTLAVMDKLLVGASSGGVFGATGPTSRTNNGLAIRIYPKGGSPFYAGSRQSSSSSGTTHTNPVPLSVRVGDTIFAFVMQNAAATLSAAGWTPFGNAILWEAPTRTFEVFRKIATASDASSGQWTFSSDVSAAWTVVLVAVAGARNVSIPIDEAIVSSATTSHSTPAIADSLTESKMYFLVVAAWSSAVDTTWPSETTSRFEDLDYGANTNRIAVWEESREADAAYASFGITTSASAKGFIVTVGLYSDAGHLIVGATGIASEEAFGNPSFNVKQVVAPTGLASEEAFGAPTVAPGPITVSPTGIASEEAFGSPFLNQPAPQTVQVVSDTNALVNPNFDTGVTGWTVEGGTLAAEATGQAGAGARVTRTGSGKGDASLVSTAFPVVVGRTVEALSHVRTSAAGTSIRHAVRFLNSSGGVVSTVQSGNVSIGTTMTQLAKLTAVVPAGAVTARYLVTIVNENNGVYAVVDTASASEDPAVFGSPTVRQITYVSATGMASAEAFGNPSLVQVQTVAPVAIASEEAFGVPLVVRGPVTVGATGIVSEEAFGVPSIFTTITVSATGIASEEAFGAPTIRHAQSVTLVGIASEEAFGMVTWVPGTTTVAVVGIASEEVFGIPMLVEYRRIVWSVSWNRGLLGVPSSGGVSVIPRTGHDIIVEGPDEVDVKPVGQIEVLLPSED